MKKPVGKNGLELAITNRSREAAHMVETQLCPTTPGRERERDKQCFVLTFQRFWLRAQTVTDYQALAMYLTSTSTKYYRASYIRRGISTAQ